TFRINPDLDVETAITELKVGEALVWPLQDDGPPPIVLRTLIKPPRSRLGPIIDEEGEIVQSVSPYSGKYDEAVDRQSAAEVLAQKAADAAATAREVEEQGREQVAKREQRSPNIWGKALKRATGAATGSGASIAAAAITGRKSRANPAKTAVSSGLGSIATDLAGPLAGRFVRNLIGGLM